MKNQSVALALFLFFSFTLWTPCLAQTSKVHETTTEQGETTRTAYVTYSEFQSARVGESGVGNASASTKIAFGELLSVPDMDEVLHVFGKPDPFTHESPFGQNILAYLNYEGMRLEYVRYNKNQPGSTYDLLKLELTSKDWSLTINGDEFHPGMSVNELSPAVRQTLDPNFSESNDAFGSIVITKPDAAKNARRGVELEAMRGGGTIQFVMNDGVVDEIKFHRML